MFIIYQFFMSNDINMLEKFLTEKVDRIHDMQQMMLDEIRGINTASKDRFYENSRRIDKLEDETAFVRFFTRNAKLSAIIILILMSYALSIPVREMLPLLFGI